MRSCVQYLHRNRDRMRYQLFEAQGLCTSSGVVEAGCKVVVGTRLKRAGMEEKQHDPTSHHSSRAPRGDGVYEC